MAERLYCQHSGKITYADRREARAAVRGLAKRHNGKATRFYRCNACGGWHITSAAWRPPAKVRAA